MTMYRRGGTFRRSIGCQKCKVVSLKAPTDGSKRRPRRRTLSAVSPRNPAQRQPRRAARRSAWRVRRIGNRFPRPRAGSLLPLALGRSVSLPPEPRVVDPSRLEVTTGHRLNQSKPPPPVVSLLPSTRVVSTFSLCYTRSYSLFLSRLAHLIPRLSLRLFLQQRSPFTLFFLLPVSSRPGSSTGLAVSRDSTAGPIRARRHTRRKLVVLS